MGGCCALCACSLGLGALLGGGGKLLQGGDGGTGVAVRLGGGGDLSGVPSASGGQLQFCSGGSTEGPPHPSGSVLITSHGHNAVSLSLNQNQTES